MLADVVVGKIDYDFAGLGVQTSVVCQAALRAKAGIQRLRPDRLVLAIKLAPQQMFKDIGASGAMQVSRMRIIPKPGLRYAF
jgi:hypothetical protein